MGLPTLNNGQIKLKDIGGNGIGVSEAESTCSDVN